MSTTANEDARMQALTGSGGMTLVSTAAGVPPIAFQAFDRRFAISTAWAPTSGTLTMTGIWLPQGAVVNAITFMAGAQAEATGTHLFYALYRADTLALLAQATDNTGAAAFGASLSFRMALTAAVSVPYTGLYYLGFVCVASGNVPTLLNITSGVATNLGAVASTTPILAATSTTSIASGTAPNPAGTLTAITQCLWAGVD
jgi:hypothetical protein